MSMFVADRKSGVLLEMQFAEWLKREISNGSFCVGAPLPGIVELARSCRVSTTTVRSALGMLADDGWVKPIRHVGSVVQRRGAGVLRKRVLLWEAGRFFCYYSSRFLSALRMPLLRGRFAATVVAATAAGGRRPDLQLEELLKEFWDLVILHGCGDEVRRLAEASGHPFVAVGNGERIRSPSTARNCVGRVEMLNGLAVPEFVKRCVKKGVRSVFQVHCNHGAYDVSPMLRSAGVLVRTFHARLLDTPEAVAMDGFGIVDSWLGRGRLKLPDVILFGDDYIAQGGLIALKKHGVRTPEDVAVVTHANKGHGPVWEKPLSRMENDPVAHAAVVAKAIRAFLQGKPFPAGIVLGTVWKDGQTF
ncbi:MAG: GntR family transcriptional regulator [Kiritimatiellae bacterium]|nr:GntR family transcriptional regulator [Kiritimatiellia bacterium]